jgi:AcrR family transcriptional regulator
MVGKDMTHSKKRNSTKAAQTRERLRAAARTLFEAEGHSKVSAKAITTTCGLSTAAFFRYYKSKRDILLDICKAFYDGVIAGIEAEAVSDDVFEQMYRAQYFYLRTVSNNWEFYRAILEFSFADPEFCEYLHSARLKEAVRTASALQKFWTKRNHAGEFDGNADIVEMAMILNAMTEGYIQDWLRSTSKQKVPDDASTRALARRITRLFYRATMLEEPQIHLFDKGLI